MASVIRRGDRPTITRGMGSTAVLRPSGLVGPTGPVGPPGGSDAAQAGWINDPASQTRAALSATYARRADLLVSATAYGAVADGTTDSTAAIQAAITAVGGYGTVFLPACNAATPYMFTNLVIPPNVSLVGAGSRQTYLKRITGSTGVAVTDNGDATGIQIRSLRIDGNNLGTDGVVLGYGATLDWNLGSGMWDVMVRQCPGTAIKVRGNVATLEDVWAFESGTGLQADGAMFLVRGLNAERNTTTEIIWNASHSFVDQLQVEVTVNKTTAVSVTNGSNRLAGVYVLVAGGVTITDLLKFSGGGTRNSVYDIIKRDVGTVTNMVNDAVNSDVLPVPAELVVTRYIQNNLPAHMPAVRFRNETAPSADPTNGATVYSASGALRVRPSHATVGVLLEAFIAARTPLILRGSASQTGDLFGVQNSATNPQFRVLANGKAIAHQGLGVGNSAAATTPGTVVKKMEVFDSSGNSLGFVPIYNAIT